MPSLPSGLCWRTIDFASPSLLLYNRTPSPFIFAQLYPLHTAKILPLSIQQLSSSASFFRSSTASSRVLCCHDGDPRTTHGLRLSEQHPTRCRRPHARSLLEHWPSRTYQVAHDLSLLCSRQCEGRRRGQTQQVECSNVSRSSRALAMIHTYHAVATRTSHTW